MSITRVNELQAAEGKSEELYSFLASLMDYISGCDGCLSSELLRSQDEADRFMVIEKWASVADHKASLANYPKEKMQAAMPLIGGTPTGRYFTP